MNLIEDQDLAEVLEHADSEDLCILADHITDKGKGRIMLNAGVRDRLHAASQAGVFEPEDRALIAEEIQRFAGNTFMNLVRRGSGVPYRELLGDVASRVGIAFNSTDDVAAIEMCILRKLLEDAVKNMSDDEREEMLKEFNVKAGVGAGPIAMTTLITLIRTGGFAPYKMAVVVANAVSKALLGRGLNFATTGMLMKAIKLFAGPIGWALTALWTSFDLASPAYRITMPCVVQIAYMRQKANLRLCSACGSEMAKTAKFCHECGASAESHATENAPA